MGTPLWLPFFSWLGRSTPSGTTLGLPSPPDYNAVYKASLLNYCEMLLYSIAYLEYILLCFNAALVIEAQKNALLFKLGKNPSSLSFIF